MVDVYDTWCLWCLIFTIAQLKKKCSASFLWDPLLIILKPLFIVALDWLSIRKSSALISVEPLIFLRAISPLNLRLIGSIDLVPWGVPRRLWYKPCGHFCFSSLYFVTFQYPFCNRVARIGHYIQDEVVQVSYARTWFFSDLKVKDLPMKPFNSLTALMTLVQCVFGFKFVDVKTLISLSASKILM